MSLDHDEHDIPRELTILYATETGNAQDVAERLARYCRRLHFSVRMFSIDEYSMENIISEHLIIFLIATAGSGREPRTMTPFWNMLLRSDLPHDLFDHLEFAVFGLGDSAYDKFCWPAKLLSRRLSSLGATEIVGRGEADDQHHLGLDGALDPWIATLSGELLKLFPLPSGVEIAPDTIPEPRVSVIDGTDSSSEPGLLYEIETDVYHTATIVCNKRITAEDWYQDVRHLEFDFQDDIQYGPGDIAVIEPEVSAADVDAFLISMGWANSADETFTIRHALLDQSLPNRLPRTVTIRTLFTKYLDFNAVPRRSFFALLRYFTTDDLEIEKLDEFLAPDGAEELYDYCYSVRRTIREVLEEFRSAKIPREYLFDLFPPVRPREFSIASSVHKHARKIQLCVAIVNYRTKLKIPRKGVATTYLAALHPGDQVSIRIKKGLITLPEDVSTPVICVGPGTGIAPMRAVIEERILLDAKENTLYQGCRSASKDKHYHQDFSGYAAEGHLEYRAACSRDGLPGVQRTYVQDLISEDAERIWELVGEKGAWVYISGSSNKMPAGVKLAIQGAAVKFGGKSEGEAKEFVAVMEKEGKLIEDCWD
ncbi:hypothetical protein PHLCEN_2v8189 [Hermanssonia centrifuga]|uniref:NADPH-dependent diflavin oxidoreductase 1 n=1 Tax=Hermanssonia centrifuga TaxID=98765 RepID=A0A2R6NUD3_9APHY|nr:hypothetical protein PHLCEN_2v8189 [Hermanssonia centrifuga]